MRKPRNPYKGDDQLCWNCANAVPGCRRKDGSYTGCPWSMKFKPVPGWTATPVVLGKNSISPVDSYYITACPMFERG